MQENDGADVCFLDWQLLSYASPAVDLIYYIFTTTDKVSRRNEYQNLVKIYYDQLTTNIQAMGSDPEKLFSYEDFQNELKRCGNIAIINAPFLLQISLSKSDSIVDMTEMCEEHSKSDFLQNSDSEFEHKFRIRMSDAIDDLLEWGYYRRIE